MPSAEKQYQDIEEVRAAFAKHGVSIIYAKLLAPNQDNEKNQIYLGRGLTAVTNVFPAKYSVRSASNSTKKRRSDPLKDIIEGKLEFFWVGRDGALYQAPNAKLIEYFQYPEVRLSGFLSGSKWSPAAIRRDKQDDYGKRILLFGVTSSGAVLALCLTEIEDPIVLKFNWATLPKFEAAPLLSTIAVGKNTPIASATSLLRAEMAVIVQGGWHEGRRLLPNGSTVPFTANQAGGYTLEALLGIRSNSAKVADKYGHEIKAYSSSRVTLMTPAPDGGEQGHLSFSAFMSKHGWKSKTEGRNSVVFNGQHVFGVMCSSSKLTLVIDGYDLGLEKITDLKKFMVSLRDLGSGADIASWSLDHLASSWSTKHAAALYVPCSAAKGVGVDGEVTKQLRYGPTAWITAGTDIMMLIKAIASGLVFYDPADEVPTTGRPKNRPQWRFATNKMPLVMATLYRNAQLITL